MRSRVFTRFFFGQIACEKWKTPNYLLGHWDRRKTKRKSLKALTLFVPVKYVFTGTLLGQNWGNNFYLAIYHWLSLRFRLPALLETMRERVLSRAAPPGVFGLCRRLHISPLGCRTFAHAHRRRPAPAVGATDGRPGAAVALSLVLVATVAVASGCRRRRNRAPSALVRACCGSRCSLRAAIPVHRRAQPSNDIIA